MTGDVGADREGMVPQGECGGEAAERMRTSMTPPGGGGERLPACEASGDAPELTVLLLLMLAVVS